MTLTEFEGGLIKVGAWFESDQVARRVREEAKRRNDANSGDVALSRSPSAMADVAAPEIRESYEDVRNDKTETNWLLLDYEGEKRSAQRIPIARLGQADARSFPTSDKLKLTATGTGVPRF